MKEPGAIELTVGVHLGPTIPITALGPTFLPRLEVGIVPGPLDRRLHLFATGTYSQPIARGTVDDPRVPGGTFDWELRQSEVALGLGASFDLLPRGHRVHPEVALAPQLFILGSKVDGSADSNAFGESTERYVQPGLLAAVGCGYGIGPGRLMARVELATAPLIGQTTGKSTTTAIDPTLGYRFYF